MSTEKVKLEFKEDAIEEIATIAVDINAKIENIGARRLQTVMERVLEDISFNASENPGKKYTINAKYVKDNLGELAKDADLSRFYLII